MPAAFSYRSRAAPLVRPVPQLVDGLSSWRNPSHHEPKLMGIASLHPSYELYAACSVDRVTSPRPANRPAMEISSSMASQCRPTRLNSTCSRSADVACNSRGNHASGTAKRPAVGQLDPHRVFVKSNAGCRSGHAMLSKAGRRMG
jgi:hypothetical protein